MKIQVICKTMNIKPSHVDLQWFMNILQWWQRFHYKFSTKGTTANHIIVETTLIEFIIKLKKDIHLLLKLLARTFEYIYVIALLYYSIIIW